MRSRPRIAVVSSFLDKQHGTERCVSEQVERLARDYGYEVHLYCQKIEDIAMACEPAQEGGAWKGGLIWHRVPAIPGPHLIRYVWWFLANSIWRSWDRRWAGLRFDLVYSPGVNCADADVISLHVLFREFWERVHRELQLGRSPLAGWPRMIHRRLYYCLIMALERWVYTQVEQTVIPVSRKTANDLRRLYGSSGHHRVVYYGVNGERFSPERRLRLRDQARGRLSVPEQALVLLLVGNDWKGKGLACLLEALAQLPEVSITLLVAGRDDRVPYEGRLAVAGLAERVQFLPPRPDVEFYYAAADVYVGPSLEDAFALPPLEAMACGLPVIVSSRAGVSEVVTDGVDALVLQDPGDAGELAGLIRLLREDAGLRRRLGENAITTARKFTWERNAAELHEVFQEALGRKAAHAHPRH